MARVVIATALVPATVPLRKVKQQAVISVNVYGMQKRVHGIATQKTLEFHNIDEAAAYSMIGCEERSWLE